MIISDEELLLELDRRFKEYKNMLTKQKELSRELVSANKKLMESEALKTHFISSITNEIINPFSSVLGLSRNILQVNKENWEKVKNMVRLIHSEAFNLDFQFRNMFAAANIEAGELIIESANFNLLKLVHAVVDSYKHEAEKKNIQITVNNHLPCETFNSDHDKLKLIVSNLLSNAIRYNNENGKIGVTLEFSNKNLRFSIKDTGIGIIEQNMGIIFDRFKKLHDQINSINCGHGLGLSIVRSLVELLNGSIHVQSETGTGSEFIVIIPESGENTSIYQNTDENDINLIGNNEIF